MLARKALAGTAGAPKEYVEDVFSCFLYTGNNNTAQTITNNIDLSTEGGLIWFKDRSNVNGHFLIDTVRGANSQLRTHSTAAETTSTNYISSFNNNGFTLGTNGNINGSETQVSWTFRKAKKFFDVVTYTGNGSTGRNISHNLGSTPGCIIVKSTTGSDAWIVYHRGADNKYGQLAATNAFATDNGTFWGNGSTFTAPTSTVFTVSDHSAVNGNGATYVAYLFAHDAGGFGDAGSDSIIKCGSYTNNSSAPVSVNLGWEPQWILIKVTSGTTGGWQIVDNMRGISYSATKPLEANSSVAEGNEPQLVTPTATGFDIKNNVAANFNSAATTGTVSYIYIAIRRGPMKTPTSGTSVFSPQAWTGNGTAGRTVTCGFSPDLFMGHLRGSANNNTIVLDKLRGFPTSATGSSYYLLGNATDAEADTTEYIYRNNMDGIGFGTTASGNNQFNGNTFTTVGWFFQRAPGFFDEVCYTGTGSNIDVTHSLGVTPEFIIGKSRSDGFGWICYHKDIGSTGGYPNYMVLNSTQASGSGASTIWRGVSSTTFSYGTNATLNSSGSTYVAYLFASVSGVSKVGSYTGTGSPININCGFTNGARFVLIKQTDSADNWYVWDTARGIVTGNEKYLQLNKTDVESTAADDIDPYSAGFTVNSLVNSNGASYIYLAIA